jgi:hypothetical protein
MLSELERIGEEAVVTIVKVLSCHFPGVTEEDHKTLSEWLILPEIQTRQLLNMSKVVLLDLIFSSMKEPLTI